LSPRSPRQREQSRFDAWQQWSQQHRSDPRLIAYYTFKRWEEDRWEPTRQQLHRAAPAEPARAGGMSARAGPAAAGRKSRRWSSSNPGDRVRLNLDGRYTALTLACWVKVDSVDKKYSGLLLTDGYDNGEPHWQIYEDGSLMFSVVYRPDDACETAQRGKYNQMHFSPNPSSPPTASAAGIISPSPAMPKAARSFSTLTVSRWAAASMSCISPVATFVFGPCETRQLGPADRGSPIPHPQPQRSHRRIHPLQHRPHRPRNPIPPPNRPSRVSAPLTHPPPPAANQQTSATAVWCEVGRVVPNPPPLGTRLSGQWKAQSIF
jgi:hypothetical protein